MQYLKVKDRMLSAREGAAVRARQLATAGMAPTAIYEQLVGPNVNRRFLERSLYDGRATACRSARGFPTFARYRASAAAGAEDGGMAWARVASVERIGHAGPVYDFTVAHRDHNFIASASSRITFFAGSIRIARPDRCAIFAR